MTLVKTTMPIVFYVSPQTGGVKTWHRMPTCNDTRREHTGGKQQFYHCYDMLFSLVH